MRLSRIIKYLRTVILFGLIGIPTAYSYGQNWPKVYGDNIHAYVNDIKEDYDKGYMIGGSILSDPNTFRFAWIIKTDINGNEIWNKKFGNGIDQIYMNSCAKTYNESMIICGGSAVEDPQFDPLFFVTNPCGEPEWCKILLAEDYNVATDVISVDDGYIGLLKYYGEGSEYSRISLVKMDQTGEPLWIQRLAEEDTLINNEEGSHLIVTIDSNYLVTGQCFAPGLKPFWIKTDTSGSQIWDLMWQGGIGVAYQAVESNSKDLYSIGAFAETGMPFTPTIFKFDRNGNAVNNHYLLGDTIDGGEAKSICFNNDSTLCAGVIWGSPTFPDITYYSEIFMLDTLGSLLYRKLLLNETRAPKCIIKINDDKIIVAGDYVVDANWDIYLWKMNQDLEDDTIYTQPMTYDSLCPYPIISDTVDLNCSLFVSIDEIPTKEEYESTVKISPNPATEWITLSFPDNLANGKVELSVFDLFGRQVLSKKIFPENRLISLNVSELPSGLYLIIAYDSRDQVMKGKFVISR